MSKMFLPIVSKAISVPNFARFFRVWEAVLNFLSSLNLQNVLIVTVLIVAFLLRVINLNYNSPFSDEAIYVVVGQLGIFGGDWFSLNAGNWLSGNQYVYPLFSGLAYALGGIVGSRFLSVIAGTIVVGLTFLLTKSFVEEITFRKKRISKNSRFYKILSYKFLTKGNTDIGFLAGIISAALVAGSATSLYVSRLATMDMIAFAFLFGSLYLVQKELNKIVMKGKTTEVTQINGQRYFVAGMLLALSALVKMSTFFYFPLFILYGLVAGNKIQRKLFISYFLIPLLVLSSLYVFYNFHSLKNFAALQAGRERSSILDIATTIWQSLIYLAPFAIVGAVLAPFATGIKKFGFLLLGALWIVLVHLINMRVFTLDKHLDLTVIFISILSGIGIAFGLKYLGRFKLHLAGYLILLLCLLSYFTYSYREVGIEFNTLWTNSDASNQFLASDVTPGDKVLSETGASTILSLFPKLGIEGITTFDYLKYQGVEGDMAYINAVRDGYFKYIELESNDLPKNDSVKKKHDLILANMDTNYEVAFEKNGFIVYRRAF